jgi:glutamate synthase (NADPH/NADH) small chain
MTLRTSSSHEEGCDRTWSVMTEKFLGDENGKLRALQVCDVRWENRKLTKIPGSEREIPCELALLAIGFVHPDPQGIVAQLDLALDQRGNIETEKYHSSQKGVFAAGDARRGPVSGGMGHCRRPKSGTEVDMYLKKLTH